MNNGNNPANPLTGEAYTNFASYDENNQFTSYDPQCQGLTKREHFAALAMQGLLVNSEPCSWNEELWHKNFARQAANHADALLAELEK